MAKRGKYNRKRRQGRWAFLYKLLILVVICGAIGVALALFFKVETIEVAGNSRYTAAQILEASTIRSGDNMFLLNKYRAAERISSALPYVESVQMERRLPNTLVISVTECIAPAAIRQDGAVWLLSAGGKLVDSQDASAWERYTQLTGVTMVEPQVGQPLRVPEEEAHNRTQMLALLECLLEKDMLSDTQSIDLTDDAVVALRYMDRFDVTFRRDADFSYKLDYLRAVVSRLEGNEKGSIDMTQDEKASFIPE